MMLTISKILTFSVSSVSTQGTVNPVTHGAFFIGAARLIERRYNHQIPFGFIH